MLHGVTLAVQELTDHGLTAGDVTVTLDPNTAVGLITALGHLLLDLFEDVGIVFAHPIQVQHGGLDKGVLGVQIHQGQSLGVGSGALADGLSHGPQPGGIHVGVTNNGNLTTGTLTGTLDQSGSQDLRDLGSADTEFFFGSLVHILDQVGECGHQALMSLHTGKVFAGQACQLQGSSGVEDEVADGLVHDDHADTLVQASEVLGSGLVTAIVFIRHAL